MKEQSKIMWSDLTDDDMMKDPQTARLDIVHEIRKICNHDIKSPLTAILESCSMLFEQASQSAMEKALMENVNEAIERVFDMVDQIHLLIVLQDMQCSCQSRQVNLIASLQSVRNRLKYRLDEKKIHLIIKANSRHVFFDPKAIKIAGDEFIFGCIVKSFLEAMISEAVSPGTINLEVLYGDDIQIRLCGDLKLPMKIQKFHTAFITNNVRNLQDKPEWIITHQMMKTMGANISYESNTNTKTNPGLILRFPVMTEPKKQCAGAQAM